MSVRVIGYVRGSHVVRTCIQPHHKGGWTVRAILEDAEASDLGVPVGYYEAEDAALDRANEVIGEAMQGKRIQQINVQEGVFGP